MDRERTVENINIKNHLALLGHIMRDKVTSFQGVVVSVSFDLYGCVQAILNPGVDNDGKLQEKSWFDVNRLEKVSEYRVMEPPQFDFGPVAEGKQGAAEKPTFSKV